MAIRTHVRNASRMSDPDNTGQYTTHQSDTGLFRRPVDDKYRSRLRDPQS